MNNKDRIILKYFAEKIRKVFPDAQIRAFGSRVQGNASEFSDLDVCVVVEKFDESIDKIIMNIAWETGFEYDIVISTVTFSKHDFEHGAVSSSQFVKSVILSGVAA